MRTGGDCRTVDREISRFPRKERLHMPGSSTTPGRPGARDSAPVRVAFRARHRVRARRLAFAAQWLAYALPYRRFVAVLADANARLGADVDRYSFIVVDLHHLLLAGLPAHFESYMPSHAVRSPPANMRTSQYRTDTPGAQPHALYLRLAPTLVCGRSELSVRPVENSNSAYSWPPGEAQALQSSTAPAYCLQVCSDGLSIRSGRRAARA